MKEYWYSFLSEKTEKNVEEFIIASTKVNNNGYLYHPV
jgi:nucleoside recognition membrane protein YjiH